MSEGDALALMREYNLRSSPRWTDRELVHKVKSAATARHANPRGHLIGDGRNRNSFTVHRPAPAPTPAAKLDPSTAVENFLKGFRCTAADLIAASTCKIPSLICGPHFHRQGAYLIDQLFEPGERVNIVTKTNVENGKARPGDAGTTLERSEWESRLQEPSTAQPGGAWLRMNPLDGQGVADANVTAFRFALIEIDCVPVELQLALLARLPLPVAAILSSGGRSYHAWVRVDARDGDDYRRTVVRLLEVVGKFGVDGKNKNPSRLSRLPGAKRIIGAVGDGLQRLLYLNPQPEQRRVLG